MSSRRCSLLLSLSSSSSSPPTSPDDRCPGAPDSVPLRNQRLGSVFRHRRKRFRCSGCQAVEESGRRRRSMAGSNDETVEVDANEERRLCGLAGDDDEEDLREDAEELFGRSAHAPVDADDDQGGGGTANQDGEGSEDDDVGRGSRPSTSAVWQDFQKLFKKVPGKKKPVRYATKCLYCSKQYSAYSRIGTGHLIHLVWSGNAKEDFLSVVAHYINSD